jgi:hypothetical protein
MGYSSADINRLTGLSLRRLIYWDEAGAIKPSIAPRGRGQGPRARALYSESDLRALQAAARLEALWGWGGGLPVEFVRLIGDAAREQDGDLRILLRPGLELALLADEPLEVPA